MGNMQWIGEFLFLFWLTIPNYGLNCQFLNSCENLETEGIRNISFFQLLSNNNKIKFRHIPSNNHPIHFHCYISSIFLFRCFSFLIFLKPSCLSFSPLFNPRSMILCYFLLHISINILSVYSMTLVHFPSFSIISYDFWHYG